MYVNQQFPSSSLLVYFFLIYTDRNIQFLPPPFFMLLIGKTEKIKRYCFFLHLPVNYYFGCFLFGTIVNNAAMNSQTEIFGAHIFSLFMSKF